MRECLWLSAVMLILTTAVSTQPPLISKSRELKENLLKEITEVGRQSSTANCLTTDAIMLTPVRMTMDPFYGLVIGTIDFVASLLNNMYVNFDSGSYNKLDLLNTLICGMLKKHGSIFLAKTIFENESIYSWNNSRQRVDGNCHVAEAQEGNWSSEFQHFRQLKNSKLLPKTFRHQGMFSFPYYHCRHRKWLTSYSVAFRNQNNRHTEERTAYLSVDLDLSDFNINQCNSSIMFNHTQIIDYFSGTHKCHRESSYCRFSPGYGWTRGGYTCICRDGFYSEAKKPFNGSYVEVTFENWVTGVTDSYEYLYKCLKCHPGCTKCNDGSACLAEYNWTLRIVLLSISLMCIVFTLIIMVFVYHMRSQKVFKMASPTFLQICLFGCISMYLEMAAIFPVLNMFYCIFTKWTRHLGFCLTFSALLMKTWRVSLTYRVKSAHKIKLTDKQLLQWMTPIILIMVIYLGSWTISDPPVGEDVLSNDRLVFKQCTYNWWDHSIAIGEMLFLLWGSKVCFGVRKAESFFDEAKCIALAVYSITIVNVVMASFQ